MARRGAIKLASPWRPLFGDQRLQRLERLTKLAVAPSEAATRAYVARAAKHEATRVVGQRVRRREGYFAGASSMRFFFTLVTENR